MNRLNLRHAKWILLLPLMLVFIAYQNCGLQPQVLLNGSMSGGNGESYTGIRDLNTGKPTPYSPDAGGLRPGDQYFRLIGGMTCESSATAGPIASHAGLIELENSIPVLKENSCSRSSVPIHGLEFSSYVPDLLGYKQGIYEKRTTPVDPATAGDSKVVWCRSADATVAEGTDIVIEKATGVASGNESLNLNFLAPPLDARVNFTRASSATYTGSDGLLKTAAANEPRFDFDPKSKSPLGLLVEESRTNFLTFSEDFTQDAWYGFVSPKPSIQPNAFTAPDGTLSADRLSNITDDDRLFFQQVDTGPSAGGRTFSFSIWVKGVIAADQPVTLMIGEVSADWPWNIVMSGDIRGNYASWTRLSFSGTIGTTGSPSNVVGVAISGCVRRGEACPLLDFKGTDIQLWGAQLEEGAGPTSYIATLNTAVTRAADSVGLSDLSWANASEGTYLVDIGNISAANSSRPVFLAQSNPNDRVQLDFASSGLSYEIRSGGVQVAKKQAFSGLVSSYQVAIALKANSIAVASNGSLEDTVTSGSIPPAPSSLTLGSAAGGGALNGHLRRLAYWPSRLSDDQLVRISQSDPATPVYNARIIKGALEGAQGYVRREVSSFPLLRGTSSDSYGSNNYYFRLFFSDPSGADTTRATLAAQVDGQPVHLDLRCRRED